MHCEDLGPIFWPHSSWHSCYHLVLNYMEYKPPPTPPQKRKNICKGWFIQLRQWVDVERTVNGQVPSFGPIWKSSLNPRRRSWQRLEYPAFNQLHRKQRLDDAQPPCPSPALYKTTINFQCLSSETHLYDVLLLWCQFWLPGDLFVFCSCFFFSNECLQ